MISIFSFLEPLSINQDVPQRETSSQLLPLQCDFDRHAIPPANMCDAPVYTTTETDAKTLQNGNVTLSTSTTSTC